jgi:hypothetical protein
LLIFLPSFVQTLASHPSNRKYPGDSTGLPLHKVRGGKGMRGQRSYYEPHAFKKFVSRDGYNLRI